MIIQERSTNIVFSVHFLSSLKKLILQEWEKDYTCLDPCLDWCLIIWQNKPKYWQEKIQCNRFCFTLVEVQAALRILFSIKKLRQYEQFPWDKFVKKKENFPKQYVSKILQNYAKYFRIITVNQSFCSFNTLCNEMDKELGHGKKIIRYHLNSCRWLKLITCS